MKLENVRAKNVQGNAHTLRFLLSSTDVLGCPGHGVSLGSGSSSLKHEATHQRRGLCPWSSTQGLPGRRSSFKRCHFTRTSVCLGPGASRRSRLRGPKPHPEVRGTQRPQEPVPWKWLRWLVAERRLRLCPMMSSH